jgi:uncharacterized protein YndB with AHSA1/START domain
MPQAAARHAASEGLHLRMEREFKAPPERVFAAFTDPKVMAQWWGPEGMTCPVCEIDLRVGGKWRTCMRGDAGEHWVSGVYREVVRPRRLVLTWAWEENGVRGHETVVELDFLPAGRNTRVVLNHLGFATAESQSQHSHGWNSCFTCLDRTL